LAAWNLSAKLLEQIVRKTNDAPQNINDSTFAVTSKVDESSRTGCARSVAFVHVRGRHRQGIGAWQHLDSPAPDLKCFACELTLHPRIAG
jgi:hypothetical protein